MSAQAQSTALALTVLMFATGIGIPIFATFNGALGQQLGSAAAASAVSFAVGLVLALALLATIGFPPRAAFTFERPYIWVGAVFILFYAVSVSYAAPRIGVGNAVFYVLLGQLVAAAAIDHFGWWGAIQSPITTRRALGIAVMALGVYLARKPA